MFELTKKVRGTATILFLELLLSNTVKLNLQTGGPNYAARFVI